MLCHPSFVNAKSFTDLKAPILLNCAEADDIFPIKLMEQVRAMLDNSDKAPEHDFKLFIEYVPVLLRSSASLFNQPFPILYPSSTVHGFCARPDLANQKAKDGFEDVGLYRITRSKAALTDLFFSHLTAGNDTNGRLVPIQVITPLLLVAVPSLPPLPAAAME